jgi:agmatine deiminase
MNNKTILPMTFAILISACDSEGAIGVTPTPDPTLPATTILYTMPEESSTHEGTWLQWPHHYEYGVSYRNGLDATWVAMTKALQSTEKVHIIAYDTTEQARIEDLLATAGIALTNINFKIHPTNDVWVRDNGPIFAKNQSGQLVLQDWGFNGWGGKYGYQNCDAIPSFIATEIGMTAIRVPMVNEGGSVELDGHGVLMATKSAILSQKSRSTRNAGMTQAQAEANFTKYYGAAKFIWLEGGFSKEDVTDMHIDGIAKFVPGNKMVTMSNTDLLSWGLLQSDIDLMFSASNKNNQTYTKVFLPLSQNDVVTTNGTNLGYKGCYINFYVANGKVLVPNYNDPNDAVANNIIAGLFPGRTVVGIDVRNLYKNGGMVHCVTQQQPL